MKEQDETPTLEAESHSPAFLKKAVAKSSSLKKGKKAGDGKMSNLKRYGGK